MFLGAAFYRFFLPDLSKMGNILMVGHGSASRRVVVALVQTKILRFFSRGLGPFHNNGLDGGAQQFGIVNVRPFNYHSERTSLLLNDHTALGAHFRTIR